jgi:hypothetical protein
MSCKLGPATPEVLAAYNVYAGPVAIHCAVTSIDVISASAVPRHGLPYSTSSTDIHEIGHLRVVSAEQYNRLPPQTATTTKRDRRIGLHEEPALLEASGQMGGAEHKYVGSAMHDRIIGALELCCRRLGEMLLIQNKRVDWNTHRACSRRSAT